MELSETTVNTLKNFATINPNIVFREGRDLLTVSEAQNLLAAATIEEEIPSEFGIYDLNEFLSVLSLVSNPQLEITDKHVLVKDGSGVSKISYTVSDVDILTSPKKAITMPDADVKFTLTAEVLNKVRRAASTFGYDDLVIRPSGNGIKLTVTENGNDTANVYDIDISEDLVMPDSNFACYFDVKNLKMVEGDYDVEISSKLISQFTNKDSGIIYWCALERESSFE